MKVNKFKKLSGGKYKVFFENFDMILYEEVILKYKLLFDNDIDVYLLDKIMNENKYYEVYHLAIKYIEIKMRSKKELFEYLVKKDFDIDIINDVIVKIELLQLLNNDNYIESFINDKINFSNSGPYKIKEELIRLDFNEDDILKYLNKIPEDVWIEKINKYISKKLKINNKGYNMFINKIKYELISLGYDRYMIDELLSKVEYFCDNIEKDYDRFYKKYNKDKYKISNALYRKGYSYDEVNAFFDNLC